MKKYQKIFILSFILLFSLKVDTVHAADITSAETIISKPVGAGLLPGSGTEGTDIQSNVVFTKIIPFLITWGINLAIALAVLALIFGGFLFLASFGDEERRGRAIQTIIYAAIGLVIALTAYAMVTIIGRLQFS